LILLFIIVLDISIPYFKNDNFVDFHTNKFECQVNFISEECLRNYDNK